MHNNDLSLFDLAAHLANVQPGAGPVHLNVTHLGVACAFWRDLLGLSVYRQNDVVATLGAAGEILVVLSTEATCSRPANIVGPNQHVAIRIPSRKDFARVLARLHQAKYRHVATDHVLIEVSYLSDDDGNDIVVVLETFERGRFEMLDGRLRLVAADGSICSGRDPLNLYKLFSALDDEDDFTAPLPAGTRIGFVRKNASHPDHNPETHIGVLESRARPQMPEARCANY